MIRRLALSLGVTAAVVSAGAMQHELHPWHDWQATSNSYIDYQWWEGGAQMTLPDLSVTSNALVVRFRNTSEKDLTFDYRIWVREKNKPDTGRLTLDAGFTGPKAGVPAGIGVVGSKTIDRVEVALCAPNTSVDSACK